MSVRLDEPVAKLPYYRSDGKKRIAEVFYFSGGNLPKKLGKGYGTPDLNCYYVVRNWYNSHKALYSKLREELEWSETYVKIFDKIIKSPRLVHFMGDIQADQSRTHTYSSYAHQIKNWHPTCRWIRNRINEEIHIRYDSSLLNLYSDGNDYIAYHGDREVNGPLLSVATVSLGDTRRFYLKSNETKEVIKTELHPGDLVIMTGNLQQTHKHTVPKQTGVGPRISITLRTLMA